MCENALMTKSTTTGAVKETLTEVLSSEVSICKKSQCFAQKMGTATQWQFESLFKL
jgi:hypothetical protein